MSNIAEIRNSIVIYDDTVTPGDAAVSPSELSGLKGKTRPNGKYRYVYGILFTAAATATMGQGGAAMAAKKIWQLIKRVYLQLGGLDEPLIKSLSALDILKISQQMFRSLKSDMLSNYIRVTQVATNESPYDITTKVYMPLAPNFLNRESPNRLTGLVPLSAFVDADMQITPASSSTIDTLWTIGDIDLEVRLLCVDLDVAIPFVPVFQTGENKNGSLLEVAKGPGDTRYIGVMVTDTDDSSFTLPDAFTVTLDKQPVMAGVDPDRVIEELDLFRDVEFNDSVFPDSLPIFGTDDRELDEMPMCSDALVLEDVASGNSNACRILAVYAEELSDSAQVTIQTDHGVSKDVAVAAARELVAGKTKRTRALVTSTFAKTAE